MNQSILTGCRSSMSRLAACCMAGVALVMAAPLQAGSVDAPGSLAGLRQVWRQQVPLREIDEIHSYALIGEHIFALGTDGKVRAIRAVTGEHVWTRQIAPPLGLHNPPTLARIDGAETLLFTQINQVFFVDPKTGVDIPKRKPLTLGHAAVVPAVCSPEMLFAVIGDRWLAAYEMHDGLINYRLRIDGRVEIPPVYLEREDLFLVASNAGFLIALSTMSKSDRYAVKVDGAPRGWIALGDDAMYVSTGNAWFYAFSRDSGENLWGGAYRLPDRPQGGPIVSRTSIYQAIASGGVQRLDIRQETPNWFAHEAVRFLAEWSDRVAMLMADNRVCVFRLQTGELLEALDTAEWSGGVSNPFNDAIFLTAPRGEIRCLRPAGAGPLSAAAFHPATQPAAAPPAAKAEAEPQPIKAQPLPAAAHSSLQHPSTRPAGARPVPPAHPASSTQRPPASPGQPPVKSGQPPRRERTGKYSPSTYLRGSSGGS